MVLSKASVESEWCRKELSAGLVRELEERRVVLLPILLEDCAVPLFLRDKKYADFRTDFDVGFRDVVSALAQVTTDTQGRVEVDGHIDWSTDWTIDDEGLVTLQLVAVEQASGQPFTTLSIVDLELNRGASERHLELVNAGFETFARHLVLASFVDAPIYDDLFLVLEDAKPVVRKAGLQDPAAGFEILMNATCRRLGTDTGKDIVVNLGRQLRGMAAQGMRVLEASPSTHESDRLRSIMVKYRPDLPLPSAEE